MQSFGPRASNPFAQPASCGLPSPFTLSEPAKPASRRAAAFVRFAACALFLALPLLAHAQKEDEDDREEEEETEPALVEGTSGEPVRVTPATSPTPLPPGLGKPVLFRGECTPGGGPAACRVIAAAIVSSEGIEPIPCTSDKETRAKIEARYFSQGEELDLYIRGAPGGSLFVSTVDPPTRGCGARATGRRVGAPGNTYSFVVLHPEDPVQLGALRFPSGVQPTPQSIAVKALSRDGVGPQQIGVKAVRRLRDAHPTESVMVIDAYAGDARCIVIAEGEGPDIANWKITWTSVVPGGKPPLTLVDAFDLGADGKAEILLERIHRGEASEWVLLRRDDTGVWK